MKKNYLVFAACMFIIGLGGCAPRDNISAAQLAAPANISISVVGRLMTVSWDAVDNARGYTVYTRSINCGSGNRIINTVRRNVTDHAGGKIRSARAANGIINRGNGFVTFTGDTSITIWLMPETGSNTEVMATSLEAVITAVGDGRRYADSEPSAVVSLAKADYINQ